ncbi:hypothetical protein Pst134EA_004572 [Puccinia striiformis f. sp. tritici]|uniref:hypothetical protein n=1 Tax=Puccinia striiformis f. sp. tritici TaxID=168172 RepID=UPI002007D383|nr:hypothetical protein Pst134EA_004572 [Puccinia striiformis f. sp. tritici]KAH9470645.1 hypothetical protein Pst134EA_004572 [Puccinia striiformis f. sp. tritici]
MYIQSEIENGLYEMANQFEQSLTDAKRELVELNRANLEKQKRLVADGPSDPHPTPRLPPHHHRLGSNILSTLPKAQQQVPSETQQQVLPETQQQVLPEAQRQALPETQQERIVPETNLENKSSMINDPKPEQSAQEKIVEESQREELVSNNQEMERVIEELLRSNRADINRMVEEKLRSKFETDVEKKRRSNQEAMERHIEEKLKSNDSFSLNQEKLERNIEERLKLKIKQTSKDEQTFNNEKIEQRVEEELIKNREKMEESLEEKLKMLSNRISSTSSGVWKRNTGRDRSLEERDLGRFRSIDRKFIWGGTREIGKIENSSQGITGTSKEIGIGGRKGSQLSIPQIIRQSKPLHVYHQFVDKPSLTHDNNDGNNAAATFNTHQHPQPTIKLPAASLTRLSREESEGGLRVFCTLLQPELGVTRVSSERCTIFLDPEGASQNCDVLAKMLDVILFSWPNETINQKLCKDDFTTFIPLIDLPRNQTNLIYLKG